MKKTVIILSLLSIGFYKSQVYTPTGTVSTVTNGTTTNVGIGTSKPNTTLEVASIPDGGKLTISTGGANGNSTTPKNPSLDFAGYLNGLKARITTTEETGNTHGSKFSIWVNDGTSASNLVERFKILQNGNIGIGITAPTSKLDINGDISQINGWIINGASNKTSGLTLANSSVRIDGYNGIIFSSSATQIGSQIERMRILQNGNIGVGTSTPQAKIDINGDAIINEQGASAFLKVRRNVNNYLIPLFYYNSTNGETLTIGNAGGDYLSKVIIKGGNGDVSIEPYSTNNALIVKSTSGNVGIGTSSPNSKLDVVGKSSFSDNMKVDAKIEAKEVKVTTTPTADFVFAEDYNLPKLEEVEKFVTEKKHLPEVASAKEMEKEGVNIGEFQIKLLQKIEELTLYSIEQNKQIKKLQEENSELKKQSEKIDQLEKLLLILTSKR